MKSGGDGYIQAIDAHKVGRACVQLGAGRARMEDRVDPAVGIRLLKKEGEAVSRGDVVALVLANDVSKGQVALDQVREAVAISDTPPSPRSLILNMVETGTDAKSIS
jgi:pyrimidine-nucleoside phosphorylase